MIRRSTRWTLLATAVALSMALAACASDVGTVTKLPSTAAGTAPRPTTAGSATDPTSNGGASDTTRPAATGSSSLRWTACGTSKQCASLEVPLDSANPQGDTITLHLERRPASDRAQRIGSLLVNPGGPGVPGTVLLEQPDAYFSKTLLRRFDIVAWDPRGTGQSSPVDCVDDLDPYIDADPIPSTEAQKQALVDVSKRFVEACVQRSGDLLPYVTTRESASDMDRIRIALGEETISYLGFSYGSELGATFATLFPKSVRAMVLDGSTDPHADYAAEARSTATALEQGLRRVMDACTSDQKCPFAQGQDAMAAYDRLMAKLDSEPITSKKDPDRPAVGQAVALWAVIQALYLPDFWPLLYKALALADAGDGSGLQALADAYFERNDDGTWPNTYEDLIAINCIDDPGPQDLTTYDGLVTQLTPIAPHFAAAMGYGFNCLGWPSAPAPKVDITGKGAGPILVVGASGDAFTPLDQTKAMAAALEGGVLLVRNGEGHTSYASGNSCIRTNVDNYLVDRTVPKAGTTC